MIGYGLPRDIRFKTYLDGYVTPALYYDTVSGHPCEIAHDCPEIRLCMENRAYQLALLCFVEDSFDVRCHLGEGLFPAAACT